jgi:hypothetical protein
MTHPLFPSTITNDKQDHIVGSSKLLLGKNIGMDSLFVGLPANCSAKIGIAKENLGDQATKPTVGVAS